MTPKVLINWLELEEILEGEHYTQQVVAGQEETEERTAEEEHLEKPTSFSPHPVSTKVICRLEWWEKLRVHQPGLRVHQRNAANCFTY